MFLTVLSLHCGWTNCGTCLPHGSPPQNLCCGASDAGRPPAEAEGDYAGYGKLRKVGSVCVQECSGLSHTPRLRQRYSQSLSVVSWSLGVVNWFEFEDGGQRSWEREMRYHQRIKARKTPPSCHQNPPQNERKVAMEVLIYTAKFYQKDDSVFPPRFNIIYLQT